jgi:ribose transport system substrate-binding protein
MRKFICVVAACAAMASLAACGDGDDASAPAATSAAAPSTGALAKVDAQVATLRAAPKPLEIPTLARKPASGKTAYWISCKFPECEAVDPGLETAMKRLGWTLKTLRPDQTPEAVVAAWTQAVAAKPAAIFAVYVFPTDIIKAQLDQAQRNGTSVVLAGAGARAGEHGIDASIASQPWIAANGAAAADWAIADSKGKADMVTLLDPSIPLHQVAVDAAKSQARSACPDCRVSELPVKLADAGKAVPGEVVSYLQKNPKVDYVLALGNSTLGLGVAQAIKSAGLTAKVGTVLSTPQNLQAVAKGLEAVAVPTELSSLAWRMADAAVRLAGKESLPPAIADPVGARQAIDASNIGAVDTSRPWDVPDVETTFLKAWRLG